MRGHDRSIEIQTEIPDHFCNDRRALFPRDRLPIRIEAIVSGIESETALVLVV